jgi:Family of unknown function (DUF6448)
MRSRLLLVLPLLGATGFLPRAASAHCDTLDGPVVTAARTALESGKIEPLLAWVQAADEEEIRHAFGSARSVRKAGKEARELADRWFFETVVRVHRAGEGAPFTGLKPAGAPDPAVAAADRVIAGGEPKQLAVLLEQAVHEGLHEHVARLEKEHPPADDVAAGRRWVAAYVPFVHWAEGVYAAAAGSGEHGADHAGHRASGHAEHKGVHATPKAAKAESGHDGHR